MSREYGGYSGYAASSGSAAGRLHRADRPARFPGTEGSVPDPGRRIVEAFSVAARQLNDLADTLHRSHRGDQASLLIWDMAMARNELLRAMAVTAAHRYGLPPAQAVRQAVDGYVGATCGDAALADQVAAVRHVGRRVIASLQAARASATGPWAILVGRELSAADLLGAGPSVVGAVSVCDGPESPVARAARSLSIPLLLAVSKKILTWNDGAHVAVDANCGRAVISRIGPPRGTVGAGASGDSPVPLSTLDGYPVGLRLLVSAPAQIWRSTEDRQSGAVLPSRTGPTQKATGHTFSQSPHAATGQAQLWPLGRIPVTVRATVAARSAPGGSPPLARTRPEELAREFRSVLRAGGRQDLDLALHVEERADWLAGELMLNQAAHSLGISTPPRLGASIRSLRAAEMAEDFARMSAFLSIDLAALTAQVLGHSGMGPPAPVLSAHPAVLRTVCRVVNSAQREHRPIAVCGEAAAHSLVLPLLIGLGCDTFCAEPASLSRIRAAVCRLRRDTCTAIASAALVYSDPEDIRRLVQTYCSPSGP
ncbi:putative PEP-binding protein [Streptomyces sp. NPDC020800]|uniref:putative PEP-binding protein n=1 Tax=Streptomyces sp. NPDC020800 TaxID=3365092 RepID=UPI0037AEEA82